MLGVALTRCTHDAEVLMMVSSALENFLSSQLQRIGDTPSASFVTSAFTRKTLSKAQQQFAMKNAIDHDSQAAFEQKKKKKKKNPPQVSLLDELCQLSICSTDGCCALDQTRCSSDTCSAESFVHHLLVWNKWF
jgi:hypothetical protein